MVFGPHTGGTYMYYSVMRNLRLPSVCHRGGSRIVGDWGEEFQLVVVICRSTYESGGGTPVSFTYRRVNISRLLILQYLH